MKDKKGWKKYDASIALSMILVLMLSLIGMNIGYVKLYPNESYFPISQLFLDIISNEQAHFFHEINWWTHIALVFIFLNILPYSKHFHVVMSIPNVYFSNLEHLGKIENMPSVTKEVKLMMELGDSVTTIDDNGDSALHGSVMRGGKELTLFLLDQGATLSHVNERGWSPLTIAQGVFYGNLGRRFPELETVLLELGATSPPQPDLPK